MGEIPKKVLVKKTTRKGYVHRRRVKYLYLGQWLHKTQRGYWRSTKTW